MRPNRDTLYSFAVFDLDAGPVTITLPDAGRRFMSMQVIDEDHYTPEVIYGTGSYTFTREKIGTRYVSLGVRILVDPDDPEDVERALGVSAEYRIPSDIAIPQAVNRGVPVVLDKPRAPAALALRSLAETFLPGANGVVEDTAAESVSEPENRRRRWR